MSLTSWEIGCGCHVMSPARGLDVGSEDCHVGMTGVGDDRLGADITRAIVNRWFFPISCRNLIILFQLGMTRVLSDVLMVDTPVHTNTQVRTLQGTIYQGCCNPSSGPIFDNSLTWIKMNRIEECYSNFFQIVHTSYNCLGGRVPSPEMLQRTWLRIWIESVATREPSFLTLFSRMIS